MKVFKCKFSGDELCSDSYSQKAPFGDEELFEVAFEVKSRRIAKGGEDFGIGDNNVDEDGNPIADGRNADVETVIDIVDTFQLSPTGFSKKEFGVYMKGYMQKLKKILEETSPERVDIFMKGAQKLAKKLLSNFDDLQFYTGESQSEDGTLVYSYYKESEEVPRFIYIIDGMREEKY